MIPPALLRVHAGLQVSTAAGTAAAASDHPEPSPLQVVERLLDRVVLQEEAVRIATRAAAIRVSALVERLAERLATQPHLPADEQTGEFAELDVGESVAADGERAAISEHDVAGFSWRLLLLVVVFRVVRRVAAAGEGRQMWRLVRGHRAADAAGELRQPEVVGLELETLTLGEVLRQGELLRAQEVEYEAEELTVAVKEVTARRVLRRRRQL